MDFWRMDEPEYQSDYHSTYINGLLEHPFGLPGIDCEVCGETWGESRVLPYECPEELRKSKELQERQPISSKKHKELRERVAALLKKKYNNISSLLPGDDFQPGFLDVPSRPRSDFLWSSINSVVVSERIKLLFENRGFSGVVFCPVNLRKIGKREAKLPAPIPTTGEPEDIIEESPLTDSSSSIGSYYEMVITAESKRPHGTEVIKKCSACGHEEFDPKPRQLVMKPDMWRGEDVFFLSTTLWIVITDRVKKELENIRATNINFGRI